MPERKYGKPKKRNLDQSEVKVFLDGLSFTVETIVQEWRHLTAFGKFAGQDAVFKLASTQTTSPRTRNEYNWNQAVHLTSPDSHPNLAIPRNYSSGNFGELFYFIAQRFPGQPLADRTNNVSRVIPKISQIAQATYELINLVLPQDCEFVMTQRAATQPREPIGERLLTSASIWASQVEKNLDPFLKIIQNKKDAIRTSVGHGDFVIRHMFAVDEAIGVIDGEHAGIKGALYYDVAQFYLRLRRDNHAHALSHQYLVEFQKLLSPSDKATFWEELKPVLIQRYIGDLWGASKDESKLFGVDPLGEEILSDRII